jgi:hypothetical protein
MAGTGGARPGAGRKPGIPNRPKPPRRAVTVEDSPPPLKVLLRAMHYYEHQANGLMGKLEQMKLPDDLVPNEKTKEGKKLADKIRMVDKLDAKLKVAIHAATRYATKAARFVHPRLSPVKYGSRIDPTRLNEDELRVFIPLLRKCLVRDGGPDYFGSADGDECACLTTQH